MYRILGPIDAGVRVPHGRALSLLALLLVHRGAVVPVERAVDELWEGAEPVHARKALQVVASRLRTALGDGALRTHPNGYALPGELDADRFEALVARGRTRGRRRSARSWRVKGRSAWRSTCPRDRS